MSKRRRPRFRTSRRPPDAEAARAAPEAQQAPQRRRVRGIYILPNALTTAALVCGFYAIVQSMNGRFEVAAIAVFVATVASVQHRAVDLLRQKIDRARGAMAHH